MDEFVVNVLIVALNAFRCQALCVSGSVFCFVLCEPLILPNALKRCPHPFGRTRWAKVSLALANCFGAPQPKVIEKRRSPTPFE